MALESPSDFGSVKCERPVDTCCCWAQKDILSLKLVAPHVGRQPPIVTSTHAVL